MIRLNVAVERPSCCCFCLVSLGEIAARKAAALSSIICLVFGKSWALRIFRFGPYKMGAASRTAARLEIRHEWRVASRVVSKNENEDQLIERFDATCVQRS